jgi:DNA-binding NarL/FixJ family response regulator
VIRLVLADDHEILRSGLAELFASQGDVRVTGQAGSVERLLALLPEVEVDVLLLDLQMPGLTGPELVTRVRTLCPALPVLVLTMHNEPAVVQRVLDLGVHGYLSKGCDIATLMTALRTVAAGGRYVEPTLAQRMVLRQQAEADTPLAQRLSAREREVLALIVAGVRLGDIADRLCLSAKTVSTHKMNLMRKMGVDNNADLIRHALRNGLGL